MFSTVKLNLRLFELLSDWFLKLPAHSLELTLHSRLDSASDVKFSSFTEANLCAQATVL